MTQLDFIGHLNATEVAPDVFLVSAHGPIDGRIAGELRDVLLPIAAADGSILLVDLSEAHGLDDETLSVVAAAAHLALRRGERLTIITRSRSLAGRITECGLAELVSIQRSLEDVIVVD